MTRPPANDPGDPNRFWFDDDETAYPYSFEQEPAHQPPPGMNAGVPPNTIQWQYHAMNTENESAKDTALEVLDDAFDLSDTLFGCGRAVLTIPLWLISKIIAALAEAF